MCTAASQDAVDLAGILEEPPQQDLDVSSVRTRRNPPSQCRDTDAVLQRAGCISGCSETSKSPLREQPCTLFDTPMQRTYLRRESICVKSRSIWAILRSEEHTSELQS